MLGPDFVALHVIAAKCFAALGDVERARAAGSEILRNNPRFTPLMPGNRTACWRLSVAI